MNILIVGASGNLGSHLSRHLLKSPHRLNLLTHKRGFPFDLPEGANSEIVQGDHTTTLLRTGTPLTRDMVKMAMTSVVAETSRMKHDLMPQLAYPSLDQGVIIV